MANKVETVLTATDRTGAAFSSLRSRASGARRVLAGLATAFAGIQVGAFIKDSLTAADQINKLSDRLGVSTEALSEYKFVAGQTGVEFNELANGLQRLGRRVSQAAKGTGEAKDALKELGLNAERLTKLGIDEQFEIIADRMEGVTSATDRVRIAQKLFDSEGVKLLQTLKGGSTQIQALRKEYRDLGGTLSGEAADGASDALDAWGRLSAGTQALGVTLVAALGPAIADILDWLGQNIPDVVEVAANAFNQLQVFIQNAGSQITGVLSSISGGLASAADFVGLETVSKALANVSEDYDQVATNFTSAAIRLERAVQDGDTARLAGLQAGITFQQARNNALLKEGEIQEELTAKTTGRRSEEEKAEEARLKGIEQYIERLTTERDVLGLTNEELISYELNKLKASAATIQLAQDLQEEKDAFDAIAAVEKENEAIFERSNELKKKGAAETAKAWEKTGESIGDTFASAISSADSFDDALKNLLSSFAQLAQQAVFDKLAAAGGPGGGGIGGLFSGLSGLLGFANGGRAPAGTPVLVGERGPEVASFGSAANISPVLRVKVDVSGGNAFASSESRNQFAAKLGGEISRGIKRNR